MKLPARFGALDGELLLFFLIYSARETSTAAVPRLALSQLEGYRIGLGSLPGSQESDE